MLFNFLVANYSTCLPVWFDLEWNSEFVGGEKIVGKEGLALL